MWNSAIVIAWRIRAQDIVYLHVFLHQLKKAEEVKTAHRKRKPVMNSTTNASSCTFVMNSTVCKIGATIAYCMITVFSFVGNSCVGLTFYRTRTLRKPINFFIANMAISDMLIPMVFVMRNVTGLYLDSWLVTGNIGKILCKLVHVLADVSLLVSVQSLVLMSVDRFGAVVFPFRSPLITSKRCPLVIFATWIVAVASIFPLPFAYIRQTYQREAALKCFSFWDETIEGVDWLADYLLAVYVAFVFIPVALLIIIYSTIFIKLKSQQIPGEQLAVSLEKRRAKQNTNVLKMAIAIVLGFILCWLPSTIDYFLRFVVRDSYACGYGIYTEISWFFLASACAVNPCICFTFSGNYREGLKRLLNCCSSQAKEQAVVHWEIIVEFKLL